MKKNNIKDIIDKNLCIQCGVCAAICPTSCIKLKRKTMIIYQRLMKNAQIVDYVHKFVH